MLQIFLTRRMVHSRNCMEPWTHFRSLRQGVGAKVEHAKIISSEDEDLMWERGVMGTTSFHALLQAAFYYNGKKFY